MLLLAYGSRESRTASAMLQRQSAQTSPANAPTMALRTRNLSKHFGSSMRLCELPTAMNCSQKTCVPIRSSISRIFFASSVCSSCAACSAAFTMSSEAKQQTANSPRLNKEDINQQPTNKGPRLRPKPRGNREHLKHYRQQMQVLRKAKFKQLSWSKQLHGATCHCISSCFAARK
eukprot:6110624-Amphidinium_carterae.1